MKTISHNPVIWGHRGCRGEGNPPENTLPAFLEAVAQGAEGIEFDLFKTADGRIVIFHDDGLEKLTDGKGSLKEKTLAELKNLRVLGTGIIPTLEELLEAIGPRPGFTYNIELKDMDALPGTAAIVKAALEAGFTPEHFIISTFERARLPEIHRALPSIRLAALYDEDERVVPPACPVYTYNLMLQRFDEKLVAEIRAAGAVPVAWTSREPRPAKNPDLWRVRAFELILITDYPAEARAVLVKQPAS